MEQTPGPVYRYMPCDTGCEKVCFGEFSNHGVTGEARGETRGSSCGRSDPRMIDCSIVQYVPVIIDAGVS